ncbi:MAG TPA: peptidylprolyl isomerase [Alphaproteobacteria bacterium]|nr:peptidylprolyl isomerase [Alphaproteobacteria bacterium]
MKLRIGIAITNMIVGLAALPALAQQPQPLDAAADPVVAVVDGTAIRRSEVLQVQQTLPQQFQQMPIEVLFPALIERMIDAKLIANAGRKENLEASPDVKRRVAIFEERVIQEVYLNRRIEEASTPEALRARYDQFVKDNPAKEQVSARHILVASENEAKAIIVQINGGADFAKLAAEKSIDPAGKQNGGDLGFFSSEEMVPEFSAAAFAMKVGELSATPVKSQFGWHVIRVDSRRQQQPGFEEVREQLASDVQQETVNSVIAKLREGTKIERFNLDGSPRPN